MKRFAKGFLVILAPWIVVMALREFGPIKYPSTSDSLNLFLSLSILFQIVFYVLGYFISSYAFSIPKYFNQARFEFEKRRACNLFFFLSVVYIFLALIDFFIIKGAGLGELVELREKENIDGPRNSVIGLLNALLSAAPALLAVSIASGVPISRHRLFAFVVALFVGVGCTFLSGGRNSFFLSVGFVISYLMISKPGQLQSIKSLIPRKLAYFILMMLIVFVIYSFAIFLKRFELKGMTPLDMLSHINNNYIGEIAMPQTDNEFFVSCYVAFSIFIYYLTHPLSYLDRYFQIAANVVFYGAYNFTVPFRVLDLLFGSTYFDDVKNETIGVYLTLPGSLFIDFSYIGSFFGIAMIGFVFGFFYPRREFLYLRSQLVAAFVLLIILFSPFYSAFSLGNGFSLWVLIFLVCALWNFRFRV